MGAGQKGCLRHFGGEQPTYFLDNESGSTHSLSGACEAHTRSLTSENDYGCLSIDLNFVLVPMRPLKARSLRGDVPSLLSGCHSWFHALLSWYHASHATSGSKVRVSEKKTKKTIETEITRFECENQILNWKNKKWIWKDKTDSKKKMRPQMSKYVWNRKLKINNLFKNACCAALLYE